MAGVTEASSSSRYAIVLMTCSLGLFIISYGSPFWTTRMDGNAGLWIGCTDGICYERWNLWVAGWIRASQTFMTMTLILLTLGTICIFLYIFHRRFDNDKRFVALSLICSSLSSLFTFIAFLTWAANQHLSSGEALNWPFAFAGLSAILSGVTSIYLWQEIRSPDFTDRQIVGRDAEIAASRREKEMGFVLPPATPAHDLSISDNRNQSFGWAPAHEPGPSVQFR